MPTITRLLPFDSAHRVMGHKGHCRFLHGHRYTAEVVVHSPDLDDQGMVVDFAVVKEKVGGWINDNLDHNAILCCYDGLVGVLTKEGVNGRNPYLLTGNPTAENLAKEIYLKAVELLPEPLAVVRVRVWETPNCFADYPG